MSQRFALFAAGLAAALLWPMAEATARGGYSHGGGYHGGYRGGYGAYRGPPAPYYRPRAYGYGYGRPYGYYAPPIYAPPLPGAIYAPPPIAFGAPATDYLPPTSGADGGYKR
jgi:hypothetical protein